MELPLGSPKSSEYAGGTSPNEVSVVSSQAELLDVEPQANQKSILASLLAQSSRHLFGPTSAPNLPLKHQVVSIEGLLSKLSYL